MEPNSVYIHIPFCLHRCAYCDFNTYAGMGNLIPDYVDALQLEIKNLRVAAGENLFVHTIYFGGGTPSLLPAYSVEKILHALDACFDIAPDIEISLEANPGTLSLTHLQDLFSAGVNRLSLGMQSSHTRELSFLERQHGFGDVIESVEWSRQAGFENLSLDLIFGIPEQSIETWNESLTRALDLAPEHFSLYALTIEQGTPMNRWLQRGLIPLPDTDLIADMYEMACERLFEAGYLQYEISNWAKTNLDSQINFFSPQSVLNNASQHNLQYWRNLPYFGFGAGAHGFASGVRISNVISPEDYIQHLGKPASLPIFPRTPATVSVQLINQKTEMMETMMMGLRLTGEGISRTAFQARFHKKVDDAFGIQIEKLIGWGLLEWVEPEKDTLRLTKRGKLLGNRVFGEFI